MDKPVDIKVSNYFPFHFIFIGYGLLIGAAVALTINTIASIIFLPLGVILVTTHYRLSIDPYKRIFREYVWFLGIKKGSDQQFEAPDYIFINESKNNFEYGGFAIRRHSYQYVHNAYVKFHGQEESAYIGSSRKLNSILNKSKMVANRLGIPIKEPSSFGEPT